MLYFSHGLPCPPTLSIIVSDITPLLEKSSLRPPEGGNKNVTYTVSWMVGETAEPPITATADEDNKDDCERMQQRLNFISLMETAYQNQALRDIVKKLGDFEGARELYQELVEWTVLDAINSNNTLEEQQYDIKNADGKAFMEDRQSSWETPPDEGSNNPFEEDPVCEDNEPERVTGSANMKTTPAPNFDDPPGYGSFRITDYCTGNAVIVELYDGQGNLVYDGGLDSSLTCWQEKYGNGAGEGMWKGAIEHERGHVKQLAKGGGTDSVDKLAERELECYEIERKEIEKKMRKLDC